MAAAMNGKPIESDQKNTNGHVISPRRVAAPVKKSGFNLFSILLRIFTWYSIITLLLRCPRNLDQTTDESPYVCKPYFNVRNVIAPHIEPYYQSYAAPYINTVRPYYESFDTKVITPAVMVGRKYGAPRVAQAQAFGQAQWENKLQPQAQKLQEAVQQRYDATLAPHLAKLQASTAPYTRVAKDSALQTYYGHVLPTYTSIQPYALYCYGVGVDLASNTLVPSSKWAWATGTNFLDRTLLPQLRILYGENVEPQLLRIRERLGRYRDGKRVQAAVDNFHSSTSLASETQSSSSSTSTVASPHSSVSQSTDASPPNSKSSSEAPASTPSTPEEQMAAAQRIVANDLKVWQEKFAKAADEGADELEARVTEVTDRLIRNQAEKVGPSLIIQLEETVKSNLNSLKKSIIEIVEKEGNADESEQALSAAVRKAGLAIKDKAQSVRTWKQKYDKETDDLVSQAASDTLHILDGIQDLGLQEIGMRWAWTDGITHKDWVKYHQLKPKFDDWRRDVELVAVEHPGLETARAASEKIENQAMDIAEAAAKDLAQLKETGRWKISTGDPSDDWRPKMMPTVAAVAGQKIMEKVSEASEAIVGATPSSQGTVESMSSVVSESLDEGLSSASSLVDAATESAGSVASSASVVVMGEPQGTVESMISLGSASASSMMEEASNTIIGTSQGTLESVSSIASPTASSLADEASKSIIGTSQGSVENAASAMTKSASSVSAKASSSITGEEPGVLEQASDNAQHVMDDISKSASSLSDAASSSVSSGKSKVSKGASNLSQSVSSVAADPASSGSFAASSASSGASKKVWGGAEAQFVEARQIIFDDVVVEEDDTYSAKIESMASRAGENFADITRAVSEALLGVTSTQGTAARVTSLAAEQYSNALAAASSALFGPEQAATDSIVSVASSKYSEAVASASIAVYGTPTSPQQSMYSAASSMIYGAPQGAVESIQSVAASRLSEGLSSASAYYQSAKSYVSAEPTPEPIKDRLLQQAQAQYYAGIGLAHERYSEFLAAASSAVLPSQTPLHESLYNKASSAVVGTSSTFYEEPMSAASSRFSDASAAAKSNLDAMLASISSAGGKTSNLASSASSVHSVAMSQASKYLNGPNPGVSSAIYGSETPYTESLASAASSNWESLITVVSSQVYGAPTPTYITDHIAAYASGAASQANAYAGQATDAAFSQYTAVQSLIGELVHGSEPAYTESVYSRLSSFYYTAAPAAASSASSYASDTYNSASSAVSSVFTPPAAIDDILSSASSALNSAVDAASAQVYCTQKGAYEKATSSAGSAYSSMSSAASEKIYGTEPGYAETAGSSISDAASSAQKAISEAIYGTSTGTVESATDKVKESIASATDAAGSLANEGYASASKAINGEEKGAVESAQLRLGEAVESAKARLTELAGQAYSSAVGGSEKAKGKDEL